MLSTFFRNIVNSLYPLIVVGMAGVCTLQSASAAGLPDTLIVPIKVNPGLQFDIVRFQVKPGSKVKIIFYNTDDMDHNFLITKPGKREAVVNGALKLGTKGPAANYIPESPDVLWAIPVISPHQQSFITFTAPAEPEVFPFVCTYPGHGFVMYGAMYVTTEKLPDISTDLNIPPMRRTSSEVSESSEQHKGHGVSKALHPYTPVPPFLYRVFIEGASPAAIAVNLPNRLSYCWDAGTCMLRFAWKGDFLDNSDLWKGKGDALAKVSGDIFFKDNTHYPLRLSNFSTVPRVDFKGYKLVNRYPEFHYTLNGEDVFEMVLSKEDGSGIIRKFRIPGSKKPVRFLTEGETNIQYESSEGSWSNGVLHLSASQAKSFSITMSIKKEDR